LLYRIATGLCLNPVRDRRAPEPLGEELPDRIARRDVQNDPETYETAGRRYGVIISVDGRGVVTQHPPKHGTQPVELAAGSTVASSEA
jgi:hypothetical protein